MCERVVGRREEVKRKGRTFCEKFPGGVAFVT